MKQYKIILFDADGTLFDFDKAETYALQNALSESSIECTDEILKTYKSINASLWALLEQGKTTQNEIRKDRFTMLFEHFGFNGSPDETGTAFVKYLSKGAFFLDGAVDILEYLYEKYPLYLVTNGITQVQESRYERSSLAKYFKAMFISEALGVAKPHIEYFNRVFSELGDVNIDEVLIIGDSLSSDIKGGNNAGIDTCWYNPGGKTNDKGVVCTYEIAHLNELKNIL